MKINFTKLTSNAKVQLPASKSISNRVLIMQALCKQSFAITNVSNSADTIALQEMLASELNIVNANEAGTAFRFMTALLCLQTRIFQSDTIVPLNASICPNELERAYSLA